MPRDPTQLTPKQQRFVEEYIIDLNATQAYIRAGYTGGKTAEVNGPRMLGNARVAAAIAEAVGDRSKRCQVSSDRALTEAARIAFSDIRKAMRWGDGDGGVVPRDELDDDTAAAIESIQIETTYTQSGDEKVKHKVKFWDKNASLEKLFKHLGMYEADNEQLTRSDIDWKGAVVGELNRLTERRRARSRNRGDK